MRFTLTIPGRYFLNDDLAVSTGLRVFSHKVTGGPPVYEDARYSSPCPRHAFQMANLLDQSRQILGVSPKSSGLNTLSSIWIASPFSTKPRLRHAITQAFTIRLALASPKRGLKAPDMQATFAPSETRCISTPGRKPSPTSQAQPESAMHKGTPTQIRVQSIAAPLAVLFGKVAFGARTAGFGAPHSVPKWRARRDSNP
jgi:hypothetical protein